MRVTFRRDRNWRAGVGFNVYVNGKKRGFLERATTRGFYGFRDFAKNTYIVFDTSNQDKAKQLTETYLVKGHK